MKNQTSKKIKKGLSLFLAVLMVLSAWVWVAPEKAEAASTRGVPAINGSNYAGSTAAYGTPLFDGNLDRWFKFHNNKGENSDYVTINYPSQIYLDKSETLQSAGYFFNVDWHFGNSTDYRILIGANALGDNSQWASEVTSWPNYTTMTTAFNNYGFDASVPNYSSVGVYAGSGTNFDLRIVGYDYSNQGTDGFNYPDEKNNKFRHEKYVLFRSNSGNDPNTATIYLKGTPKGTYSGKYSTSGHSFKSYGVQQNYTSKNGWGNNKNSMFLQKGYGNGDTSSSNYNPGGWPEMEWNVTIYDKSALNSQISTANGYSNADGRYTSASWNNLTSKISSANSILKTRNVTQNQIDTAKSELAGAIEGLVYSDFNIFWVDHNGKTVATSTYKYGTAVNCASIAPANSKADSNNDSTHNIYGWNTNQYVTSLVNNITINEIVTNTQPHSFGSTKTYKDATYHTQACSACGHVKDEAHSGSFKITTQPGCETEGERTYTCSGCGYEYKTETIEANGHIFNGEYLMKVDGKDGSHYQKCENCDEYGIGTVKGDAVAHDFDKNNDGVVNALDAELISNPGCETAGERKYTCELCEAFYTEAVAATGHNNVSKTEGKDKSCGVDGWAPYWTCADCGKVWKDEALTQEIAKTDADNDGIYDAVEIAADSHVFDTDVKVVVGGKDGTHDYLCSNCGLVRGFDGVAGGTEAHNFDKTGDGVVNADDSTVITDSTCISTGTRMYTCTVCNLATYTEEIPEKDHVMTYYEAIDPACDVPGNIEYYYCSSCKTNYADEDGTTKITDAEINIPALKHTWTAAHDYDTPVSAATCMDKAVYNKHCDYCKVQLVGQTYEAGEVDKVNGHNFTDYNDVRNNADGTHSYGCLVEGCTEYGTGVTCDYEITSEVPGTCQDPAYVTYTCKECGHSYVEYGYKDMTNHVGDEYLVGNLDATCSTDGYTGYVYCATCNTKKADGTAIPADRAKYDHEQLTPVAEKPATCTEDGYKAYEYCAACGTETVAKVVIPAAGHDFKDVLWVSDGNDKTHTRKCKNCTHIETENCDGGTANCMEQAVCTVCSGVYGTTDADNHKAKTLMPAVPATCQKVGKTDYYKCTACGVNITDPSDVDKVAHVWGDWKSDENGKTHTHTCVKCVENEAENLTKAFETVDCEGGVATCIAAATCSVCGGAHGEADPANHATQKTNLQDAEEATCTEDGYTGDWHYDCCDAVKTNGETIDALGHEFTVEVEGSRVPSTCIVKGKVTYKCVRCDETDEVELELNARNHNGTATEVVNAVEATCTTDGYTGDEYYSCCYNENKTEYENRYALVAKGSVIKSNGKHVLNVAVPEYMLDKDENGNAVVLEEKDDEGKVTARSLKVLTEEPDYDAKADARRDDDSWYHVQVCQHCGDVVYTACYTYKHTFNCVDTDICEVCSGLCSLTSDKLHKDELTEHAEVFATCKETGKKAYYECEHCEQKYFDKAGTAPVEDEADLVTPLAAHNVDWDNGVVTKEPSCGVNGETTYYCTTKYTEDGVEKTCDYKITRANISSNGVHNWSEDYKVVKESTCYETGYKAHYCTVCDVPESGSFRVIPVKEHTWDEGTVTTPATCTNEGVKTYACTFEVKDEDGEIVQKCTATKTEVIEATGHSSTGEWIEVPSTCSVKGYKYKTCDTCGTSIEKEELPLKEHTPSGNWIIVRQPTCSKPGMKQDYCTVCTKSYSADIPATGEHNLVTIPGVESTCNTPGYSESVICDDCGAIIKEAEEYGVAVDAHHDHDGDGYCDECTYDMMEGACNCICHKQHGLMKFIYKIINFFWKLFGIGKGCRCGAEHY